MTCNDILRQIEDFYYGELDEKNASRVQSHLMSCQECSRVLESLRSEDRVYKAYSEELDRGLEVSPRLWQRVQAGISVANSHYGWRPILARLMDFFDDLLPRSAVLRQAAFASAIVMLSVAATLLTVRYYRARDSGAGDQHVAGASDTLKVGGTQNSLEAALRSIQRAERDYNDAIEVLSKIVDRRKPTLDPQLVAEVEKNLKAIDESIAATRTAYHAHPSDPELAHYMLTAYEKKVELLFELAS